MAKAMRKAKWAVQANNNGVTVSRHVLRRLAMKARAKGLVWEWNDIRVLDNGDLMLSAIDSGKDSAVTLIAERKGKGNGKQGRWEFKTEREHLQGENVLVPASEKPAEVKAAEDFQHDQHVLDDNLNG